MKVSDGFAGRKPGGKPEGLAPLVLLLVANGLIAAPLPHPRRQIDAAMIAQIGAMRDAQDLSDKMQKSFDLRSGYAALLVKTLAPSKFRYRLFAIEAYAQENVPTFEPGYGRWRVELEPEVGAKSDYFLNVLKPTLDAGATMPVVERMETADSFAAVVGGYRVLFAKDGLGLRVVP